MNNREVLTTPRVGVTRINEIDFVRGIAIILVVLLHSASPVMYQFAAVPTQVWNVHNIVDSAARICVPLFFMVSGYLLLSPNATKGMPLYFDLPKRIVKVLIPLVAWSLIYKLGALYVNGQTPNLIDIITILGEVPQGAAVYHLWFLYELIALYLTLPILRTLFSKSNDTAKYFVWLWLFLLTARLFSSVSGWNFPLRGYIDFGDAGYLVAGYLVRLYCPSPTTRTAGYAVGVYVVAMVATYYLTSYYSTINNAYYEGFHVYATPNVAIMAVSSFVFLLFAAKKTKIASGVVSLIGTQSFGIYLVHVLFLEKISYNVLGTPATSPLGALMTILATAVFALASSFVVARVIRLFAVTRWLAP